MTGCQGILQPGRVVLFTEVNFFSSFLFWLKCVVLSSTKDQQSEIWPVCPDEFQAPGEAQTHTRSLYKNASTEHKRCYISHSNTLAPSFFPWLTLTVLSWPGSVPAKPTVFLYCAYYTWRPTLCGLRYCAKLPSLSNPTHLYSLF